MARRISIEGLTDRAREYFGGSEHVADWWIERDIAMGAHGMYRYKIMHRGQTHARLLCVASTIAASARTAIKTFNELAERSTLSYV